ncbi:MAG: hypothetical protein WCP68_13310 [Enhydrobacter sp.]
MTPRTSFIAALLGGAALLIAITVWLVLPGDRKDGGASWPPAERAAFMRSCVEECRKSPGVTEDKYPLCDRACACSADEGEKVMSVQELGSTATSIAGGSASPEQIAKMERVKAAGMRCAMQAAQEEKK